MRQLPAPGGQRSRGSGDGPVEAEIVKVTDYAEIARYGIMSTPGLVIDGKVVSYGRVPSAGDIAVWLSEL